jgi:hypothetical protein
MLIGTIVSPGTDARRANFHLRVKLTLTAWPGVQAGSWRGREPFLGREQPSVSVVEQPALSVVE